MMMLFSGARRQAKAAARPLYERAVAQARAVDFYRRLGVADSLDGRFDLLALHVFLLLNRLGRDGRSTRAVGQALFDLMFTDMDGSLRELGASDISMSRRIKAMVRAFYGRIEAYENGLGAPATLAEALSRNLYRGAPPDKTQLDAMVRYVTREAARLAETSAIDDLRFAPPELP
jgi:cytochrome b pre-mRNA-processing protein 3